MKQRITYIQPEGTFIDRNSIHVNPDSVVYTNAGSAALEKRLTLGLDDLPPEVPLTVSISILIIAIDCASSGHRCARAMPRSTHPLGCTR